MRKLTQIRERWSRWAASRSVATNSSSWQDRVPLSPRINCSARRKRLRQQARAFCGENKWEIGVFGPHAEEIVNSPAITSWLAGLKANGRDISLVAIPSDTSWGKASNDLVKAVYQERVLAIIALDRPSSHLAEQIAVESFVPVIGLCSDRTLTSTNIPWIFRLPEDASVQQALNILQTAVERAGPNRARIRNLLASGANVAGVSFESTGELQRQAHISAP
jgi:hypothetical protein